MGSVPGRGDGMGGSSPVSLEGLSWRVCVGSQLPEPGLGLPSLPRLKVIFCTKPCFLLLVGSPRAPSSFLLPSTRCRSGAEPVAMETGYGC